MNWQTITGAAIFASLVFVFCLGAMKYTGSTWRTAVAGAFVVIVMLALVNAALQLLIAGCDC